MDSISLKQYIYTNKYIELILHNLGCYNIEFHEDKCYWNASRPNGHGNKMGVIIKNCEYLNYYSYSQGIHVEEGKDIFSFIQDVKKCSFADSMKYVHNLLGLKYTFKKDEPVIKKADPLAIFKKAAAKTRPRNVLDFNILDEKVLSDFVPMIYIELFREGIIGKTIKKFELGYSYRWSRTIFVHRYWLTGELMGYNARTSVENYDEFGIKKYFITPGMDKSINLYGLWENKEDIKKAGYVVVYESEKSVLKRDSLCDSTGVAISGHSLSDEQVRILIGLDVDIIISMDNDVNIQEVRYMCERLWRSRRVYYTIDKHGLLPEKSSIADASNKVFEFLMKYKVRYNEHEHQEYLKGLDKK